MADKETTTAVTTTTTTIATETTTTTTVVTDATTTVLDDSFTDSYVSPFKKLEQEGDTIERLEQYKIRVAEEQKEREKNKRLRKEARAKEKEEKRKAREANAAKRKKRLARDLTDNTLIDKVAIKYWNDKFGEKTEIVPNAEFAVPLKKYLLTKKYKYDLNPDRLLFSHGDKKEDDEKKRSDKIDEFIKIVLERFFVLPNPEKYGNKVAADFVSKDTVQCCIHIFGPWIQIFEMIKRQFFDIEIPIHIKEHLQKPALPLEVWHGRMSKEKAEELLIKGDRRHSSKKQRFLLRMDDGKEVAKIICSNIRRNRRGIDVIKHEPLTRKMPAKIHIVNWNRTRTGKSKPIPPKWTYAELLPAAGGMSYNFTDYSSLTNFFLSMKGTNTIDTRKKCAGPAKIRTPVYALGYAKKNSKGVVIKEDDASSTVESPPVYKEPEYFEEKEEDITDENYDENAEEEKDDTTKES